VPPAHENLLDLGIIIKNLSAVAEECGVAVGELLPPRAGRKAKAPTMKRT